MSETPVSVVCQDEMAAVSGVYHLLARLWMREVDQPLLHSLSQPPLRDLFVDTGGVLPDSPIENATEQLAIEFCQLFLGPKDHLPPFQSVWQTGQFQSQSATSMSDFIDAVGYNLDPTSVGVPLDHLGIQLDVMGYITHQCSLVDSADLQANVLLDLTRSFYARHLSWPFQLFTIAESRAQSNFYRSVIQMTKTFLQSEQLIWCSDAVDVR